MAAKVIPLPSGGRKESKRRPPAKVPSLHLTGKKSMRYIKEANERAKEKEAKVLKEEKIKKEAVDKSRAAERKAKKKTK